MIPKYNGAKAQKITSNTALPAGGYVARIQSAKVEDYSWGSVLVIAYDVAEGEFKDHFRKQFTESDSPDKKWKGTYRITIPGEHSKYFASEKRNFDNLIYSLEASNNGYIFDWEETSLKNKLFGALVRNKEFKTDNGEIKSTTECAGSTDIQSIRDGSFAPLKDKLLKKDDTNTMPPTASIEDLTDDDLPFTFG